VFPISDLVLTKRDNSIAGVNKAIFPRMIESARSDRFPCQGPLHCRQLKSLVLHLNWGRNWSQLGLGHFSFVYNYGRFAFPLQSKLFVAIISGPAPVFRHLPSIVDRNLIKFAHMRFQVIQSTSFVFGLFSQIPLSSCLTGKNDRFGNRIHEEFTHDRRGKSAFSSFRRFSV
jgi:hypothetical protein